MRSKLVVGNWKMDPLTEQEAIALARSVSSVPAGTPSVGVAPPAPFLRSVADVLRSTHVRVYAQDVHWEDRGAFTGQMSAPMIAGYVFGSIVGHSEVRRDQGDDDARVARKAEAALHHFTVIYCIGESLGERRAGQTERVLRDQIRNGIGRIEPDLVMASNDPLTIAYEPIWAIGTGVPATAAEASAAIAIIRSELDGISLQGRDMRILYGGSVSAANAADFAAADGVDGALVGGASLKADEFAAIVATFRRSSPGDH